MYDTQTSLEIRKASAAMEFGKAVKEFKLDKSRTFTVATEKMKGMDHGPNHTEGDPLEHSQLYVAELNSYLKIHAQDFSAQEARLLRLGGALHDIGKAGTQKYDAVSDRQNKWVGASPQDIVDAKRLIYTIAIDLSSGVYKDRYPDLEPEVLAIRKEVGTYSETKLQKEFLRLSADVVSEIIRREVDLRDHRALVANFRDHGKKSAEMARGIIQEAQVELSPEEQKLLDYLIENHMQLLDLADLSVEDLSDPKKNQGPLKIFEKLFVDGEKGMRSMNEQKIKMLLALTYADNASTHHKGESNEDRQKAFERIVHALTELRSRMAPVLEKETQDKKVEDVLKEAFREHGSLATYLMKEKGKSGKEIGAATQAVKKFAQEHVDEDLETLYEKVVTFAQTF